MTFMRSNLKARRTSYAAAALSLWLAACAQTPSDTTSTAEALSPRAAPAPVGSAGQSSPPLTMDQISTASTGFKARQISSNVEASQLTVQQLKAYADRCAPGRTQLSQGLDCSELSLRVKEVFRSDDEVQDALIILDRLGRDGRKNTGQNELETNSKNLSYSALIIANDLLQPPAPLEPEAIEDDAGTETSLEHISEIIINPDG